MTTEALEIIEEGDTLDPDEPTSAETAIATIREDAARIERRELHEAIRKLETEGEFTADQRNVITSMADALVGRLLALPATALREADDPATIDAALRLFDPDSRPDESGAPVEVADGD